MQECIHPSIGLHSYAIQFWWYFHLHPTSVDEKNECNGKKKQKEISSIQHFSTINDTFMCSRIQHKPHKYKTEKNIPIFLWFSHTFVSKTVMIFQLYQMQKVKISSNTCAQQWKTSQPLYI